MFSFTNKRSVGSPSPSVLRAAIRRRHNGGYFTPRGLSAASPTGSDYLNQVLSPSSPANALFSPSAVQSQSVSSYFPLNDSGRPSFEQIFLNDWENPPVSLFVWRLRLSSDIVDDCLTFC